MIKCNSICKSFGTQVVIDKFSYEFRDNGFYLLYGESGSGKTTFLNILCGFLGFEGGSINIDGKEYTGSVDAGSIGQIMDYIVQDTVYVEFLSVLENLNLVCEDKKEVAGALERFGLKGKENQYPSTLSGGEKQRLAIARALLGKKKILFLDEPTASLDDRNKIEVFEYLKMIKEDVLVICSSHDAVAKEYADETIQFEKSCKLCEKIDNDRKDRTKKSVLKITKEYGPKKNYHYIKKWFRSKQRNRKANILFGVFLTLAICMYTLSDTPDRKYESNMEYMYRINQCEVETRNEKFDKYRDFCKAEGISEVVIPYGTCLPDTEINHDSIMQEGPDYDSDFSTLPYNKDAFHLSNRMLYGTYYTDELQVILSYDTAVEMNRDNPAGLIGSKITRNVYRYGYLEFEIVGIFDEFSDVDKNYFRAINVDNGSGIFVSGKFTERYLDDEGSAANECKRYVLYFDTYRDMKNFYNSNPDAIIYYPNVPETRYVFEVMFYIMLPLSIFVALFTILFYINLIKTEIAYNNKFFSVFEYSGYRIKKVVNYFIRINFLYLLRICLIAAALALLITFLLNRINYKCGLFGFQLFTYNVPMIVSFIVGVIAISFMTVNVFLRRVRLSSWYENVIAQRDLL